jgi:hypothetical protein
LVYIRPGGYDRCPYGFTDTVRKQGDELFCSLLYTQVCRQLGEMLSAAGRKAEARTWTKRAGDLAPVIRKVFWDADVGLFRAATVACREPDIWGSAFAAYTGVAMPAQSKVVAKYFRDHYQALVQRGQVRHLPGGVYWESACERETYQNGGYWATPTGWFAWTLALVDQPLAERTIVDLVADFRERGVSEWVLGDRQAVMGYLASATMPLAGARRMMAERRN